MLLVHWLLSVIVVVWIYWLWTRRKFYALIFKIPGPIGFPILGLAPYLMCKEDILKTMEKYREQYGCLAFSWLGPYPVVVVSEPNLAQDILTSPDCVNKSLVYKAVDNGTGKGLFGLKDPVWSFHRKHLNPAFSHKVLLSFFPIFNEEANILLHTFENWVNNNESIDLIRTFQDFTLNVATRTTMGKSAALDAQESKRNLLESYHCIIENMAKMIFSPWLTINLVRKLFGVYEPYEKAKKNVRNFVRELIEQNLSAGDLSSRSSGHKQIFIDLAIDLMRRRVFSCQDIEEEANVIVIGAFETTASTIYYALMLLAMFPVYQQKVFEELLTIFPEGGDFEVSYSNIQDMVYLDMVLNESMRVLTPVPVVARETSNDVKLSNGVVLPAGVQVGVYIHGIHRNVDVWGPDADQFNPDNFLPSSMVDKHPYAFIPFTKGIRNCIGWRYGLLSVKLTLAKVLRNYKFSTDFQYKDLELGNDIILKLKQTPLLRIEKRVT